MPWFRVIRRPDEEKQMLLKRDNNTNLNEIDLPFNDGNRSDDWTNLSAFTFVNSAVPEYIFSNDDNIFGILVNEGLENTRNVYWRDSMHQTLSDEFFKEKTSEGEFNKICKKYSFKVVDETEVSIFLTKRYEALKNSYKKENLDLEEARLQWSEGLFRYKLSDISGVVVNPNSVESCMAGKSFMDFLREYESKAKYYEIGLNTKGFFEAEKMQEIAEQQVLEMACKPLPLRERTNRYFFPGDDLLDSGSSKSDIIANPNVLSSRSKTASVNPEVKANKQNSSRGQQTNEGRDLSAYFKCTKHQRLSDKRPLTAKITGERLTKPGNDRSR